MLRAARGRTRASRARTRTSLIGVSAAEEGLMAARTAAVGGTTDWIERQFHVRAAGSTIGTEVRGGITTFLVMSYILVVNAVILSAAGIPFPAVVAATALMAALFTAGMALWANYPYAGAAGLGINAVVAFGLVKGAGLSWQGAMGVAVMPKSFIDTPDFSTIGAIFTTVNGNLALFEVFRLGFFVAILTVFSLMLSDFFDTAGTVVSVAAEGGWLKKDGTIDRVDRVFWVDSLGALFGGLFGTSSNTTYIESGAGVAEGAKTGLASLVTAILFLLCIFLAPIAGIVPQQATAPALMLVGWFMFKPILDLNKIGNIDFATGFAVLLTLFVMPLTYSITNGVGAGFIAYSALKVASGKAKEVSLPLWVATAAFAIYFADPWLRHFLSQ